MGFPRLRQAILRVHQVPITVLDRCPPRLQYSNCNKFRWLFNPDTGLLMRVEIAWRMKMPYRLIGGFIRHLAPKPEFQSFLPIVIFVTLL